MDEAFIINVADARASGCPRRSIAIVIEPEGVRWADTGVNIQVMQPGQRRS